VSATLISNYWHRYTDIYEEVFKSLGTVSEVLEFGVLEGNSIRWLAERFPEARILGLDILPQTKKWPQSRRIEYIQLDQVTGPSSEIYLEHLSALSIWS
jgi:hypothetical protein